jgi:hypothetical protein
VRVGRRRTRFLIAVSSVWHLGFQGPFGALHGPDENSLSVQKKSSKVANATK